MGTFLKEKDSEQALQLENLASKIDGYAAALDVTPAEVASAKADALYFRYALTVRNLYQSFTKGLTQYNRLLKKNPKNLPLSAYPTMPALPAAPPAVTGGVLDRFVNLGKRMKLHRNYTTSIGKDLMLIKSTHVVDEGNAKPVLKLGIDPAGRRISYNLQNYFDGVNIYKKAPGEAGFTFLVRDSSSPYVDKTPSPAGTYYHAFFVISDKEVGLPSGDTMVN